MWERTGARISQVLVAGVVLTEFSKQVQAPVGRGQRVRVPSPLDVLGGMSRPQPAGQRAGRTARDPL